MLLAVRSNDTNLAFWVCWQGDDAAVCSSFLPAKGRALQLCTLTASGLVLVHTVGETSPKKYQLHFSPDQQCACVCPLGDKLYVGFRDGRVISSQLKTSSVEQNHVATVAGPVSLLQIVADQDLLICHNEACVRCVENWLGSSQHCSTGFVALC